MEREDVIVVASVSCIYGLGNPMDYRSLMLHLSVGQQIGRRDILAALVDTQYRGTTTNSSEARFEFVVTRSRSSLAYEEQAIRVELWGDRVERITRFDPLTGETVTPMERTSVYPASHYVTRREVIEQMAPRIREEMKQQVAVFEPRGSSWRLSESESRTNFDLEMMLEIGPAPASKTTRSTRVAAAPGNAPRV